MTRNEREKLPILTELSDNIARINELSGGSSDVLVNRFVTGGVECALICCEGMVSSQTAAEMILGPVTGIASQGSADELFSHIQDNLLLSADRTEARDYDTLFRLLNSGFVLLIADGADCALAFGVQGYASRGIQEPSGEGSILGSHEGFTEVIRTNMSLIRRRMKSPELVMELMVKGERSRTDVCLCYMRDRVPKRLLDRIRRSLADIRLESVLSTGYIRPFLEKRSFELFSSTGITERPDVLCSKLIEGRAAVLIDGVPYAIVVPRLLCESFHTLDDYAYKPYYAVFSRWLRYVAFIAAVLLPAVYTAIVMHHPELLNSTLLMLLADAEKNAPLPILAESFVVLLMYEMVREAGIRLPKPAGGAVSIISGLIIGDAAVKSGIVSTPLLTMTALAVLGGLVVPDLAPQVTVLRLAFLAAGGIMGVFGISLLACAVLTNICSTEDYGFPFTAPLSPFAAEGMGDTAVRLGMRKMLRRGFTVEAYHE
ncbi:MAG: spore germination protein [Ruminococcus sp.]|nr:spore germination protein [Ruminococcus sp.]